MSGSVRTIGEVLPFLFSVCLCVFLCCSCTFFLSLVSSSTGSVTYCILFCLPRVVCVTPKKRWTKCHHPVPTPLHPLLFLCPLIMAPTTKSSEESDRFSLVPMKSPGSSPRNPVKTNKLTLNQSPISNSEHEGMPNIHQTLFLLVQTSSCNFILESLWILGTSILRNGIFRLNYEFKLYQYVKILYVQLNCSMLVHWVVLALLFAGWWYAKC